MTTRPQILDATVVAPWATRAGRDGLAQLAMRAGRACLITPAAVDRVSVESTGQWLPLLAEWSDERRLPWRKFELPATGGEGSPMARDRGADQAGQGSAAETIRVRLHFRNEAPRSAVIRLEEGVPRQSSGTKAEAPENDHAPDDAGQGESKWRRAAAASDEMIGRHIDLITRLYDGAGRDPDVFWDGLAGGIAAWPLRTVLNTWRQVDHDDGPRPAPIVAMAHRLGPVLNDVCRHPRRVLSRKRELQSAGAIEQVDATCLRWLARQPGTTMAEKAGAKQRAMGIARVESADTLENRVVRDFLSRALIACDRYIAEHASDDDHRIAQVRRFHQQLRRLRDGSPIMEAGEHVGLPSPNYVLQHDPRYRPIWRAYVQLIKKQDEIAHAWRWRQRVWAETCQLAVLSAVAQIDRVKTAMHSDVLLRPSQRCGRFIDDRTALGWWQMVAGDTDTAELMVLDGRHIDAYRQVAQFPEQVAAMSPDAAIICRDAHRPDRPPRQVVGLWSLLDFDLNGDQLLERCKQIEANLKLIRSPSRLTGLVVQPKLRDDGHSCTPIDEAATGLCKGLRLTIPVQPHVPAIENLLTMELGLS